MPSDLKLKAYLLGLEPLNSNNIQCCPTPQGPTTHSIIVLDGTDHPIISQGLPVEPTSKSPPPPNTMPPQKTPNANPTLRLLLYLLGPTPTQPGWRRVAPMNLSHFNLGIS